MSYANHQQQLLTPNRNEENQFKKFSDNDLRENLLRQYQQQLGHIPNDISRPKSIENLKNQYKENDKARNYQMNQNEFQKNELLQKLVEDYRQLKDQSLTMQRDYDIKIKELVEKMQQQDLIIQKMSNENKTLHTYYQRAENLLSQQRDKIQELEEHLKQAQQASIKDKQQIQNLSLINSPNKLFQESETRNYVNSLSDDELIELIKLKRKMDFEKVLQQKEKADQQNQEVLPLINQSQSNPISVRQFVRHQRSSSTFKKGLDNYQDQLQQQQSVIVNQQKVIDKLLNHSHQNQQFLQKELQQSSQIQSTSKQPQIEFVKDFSTAKLNSSRLRNRSPIKSNREQHMEYLQKSIESKDKLLLDIHNSKIKKDKDEALIDFFNKQSSYLVDSVYDKKK
ncbi:hypothetical protein TTHERM_00715970 (macronuclear) [Tetrahymena thermophila SB210]|uniref:Uncharacterized protein n=1 Tax=Tetrahymena thermophila (strain SB210) TaxID=312017 RepID=I7MCM3_TETTS|nr:hypothetical protein TTHERM_00715970 [Tetrahymena thermophila SB210]EAR84291.1 hypothetical protein TTHERM_00715970 [Tetrahymena thermophila SB210]|eukprot:XP_001031954.1 hypothetical protein TTHERM_00715970 [Tetrahymena thermophila SB210]